MPSPRTIPQGLRESSASYHSGCVEFGQEISRDGKNLPCIDCNLRRCTAPLSLRPAGVKSPSFLGPVGFPLGNHWMNAKNINRFPSECVKCHLSVFGAVGMAAARARAARNASVLFRRSTARGSPVQGARRASRRPAHAPNIPTRKTRDYCRVISPQDT